MATNFPGSLDNGTSLPYPTSGNFTNAPSLAGGQDNQNDAIIAVETKVGTGASTPTNNTFLIGTGSGTSTWGNTVPAGTVVGTTDSQTLTNKTLTSPTINNPTISNGTITQDAVTGFTTSNSGTVYGIAVSSGTFSGSAITASSIGSTALATSAVQANQISASAITLGYAKITSNFTGTATSFSLITGLSITVTVPSGGRNLKVTFVGACSATAAGGNNFTIDIFDSTTSTEVGATFLSIPTSGYTVNATTIAYIPAPTAGSHTYQARYTQSGAGTFTCNATSTAPAFILAELI